MSCKRSNRTGTKDFILTFMTLIVAVVVPVVVAVRMRIRTHLMESHLISMVFNTIPLLMREEEEEEGVEDKTQGDHVHHKDL
jgi:hypothetical protein